MLDIFPDEFAHIGGDEIDFRCWTSHPRVSKWLQDSNLAPTEALHQFYQDTVFRVLAERGRRPVGTMRVELIGHCQPCMTEIYLYIDARMA